MAGTRFLISSLVLVELVVLAVWSFWYGLCKQHDDTLCPRNWNDQSLRTDLRSLKVPPTFSLWAETTLHVHLLVEQESALPLQAWSHRLKAWMETSKLSDWPYFGSLEISMQAVPTKTFVKTKKAPRQLWASIDLYDLKTGGRDLDFVLYIPDYSTSGSPSSFSWSSWEKEEENGPQLLNILVENNNGEGETEDNSNDEENIPMNATADWFSGLENTIGPWLKRQVSDDVFHGGDAKDILRMLQVEWQRSIVKTLEEMEQQSLLSVNHESEYVFILSRLGRRGSLKDRLKALKEAHIVLSELVEDLSSSKLKAEFPLEHYAAIFLPLLFPLLIPFLATWGKEYKRYKEKIKLV